MSLMNMREYHFGEFQLKLPSRNLERDGVPVRLGSKAFELLAYLAMHPGEVVTKEELLKAVWPGSYVEEKNLTQQIMVLRKALADKSDYIATIPGRGYQFTASVRAVANPAPEVGAQDFVHAMRKRTHVVIEESVRPAIALKPLRTWRYAVVAVVVIAAGIAAVRFWPRGVPPENYLGTVVADFTNTTGDATFDLTVKRAIEIELGQSPFLGVLSDQDTVNALGLMGKKPDTPLSPAIAREVCERTNQQVLLTGSIASVGQQYLLTMEATNCLTGKLVAAAKAEAGSKDKLLGAVDALADRMRAKLGESAKSVERYDVPLSQAATSSLEALRAYSTGQYLDSQGVSIEKQLPLYQKAVEFDPQFTLAYLAMARTYYELQEGREAAIYFKKAFDLRDRVGEDERLGIEARYYALGQGDAVTGLSAYQAWAAMYPHDWRPWLNIANLDNQLGNYPQAIDAGKRAVQLNPNGRDYAVAARAYKNASRFAEAKALLNEAERRYPGRHGSNDQFEIAFYEHDKATFNREVKDEEDSQWQLRNYYLGQARSMEGRYAETKQRMQAEMDEDRRLNKGEIVDGVLVELALIAREYGYPAEARAALARVSRGARDGDDVALEFAMNGDVLLAKRYIAAHEIDPHAPTDQAVIGMPRLRSAVAMQEGRPAEALAALEPARPYELAGFVTLTNRAAIYMKMGEPGKAVEDYKKILANPGAGFGVLYPMARLGLARAEAAAGDAAASRAAYQSFLGEWKNADPELPVIKAAKAELAKLGH
jgi:DNA-binding winged helix-turn-helix (wHTH) protein/tetratricopeptide (TPR) repeat protein